jgi:serine/threonine-protein phosphatase 6 regulatory ankyrin repeat subunit B
MPPSLLTLASICALALLASCQKLAKSAGPPSFFLQDINDGQCLAGDKYKRCGLDTLWFVTGKPGSYQIHHRPLSDDEDDVCLSRDQCQQDASDLKLKECTHCGAKKWNILGDADTGYVLTEDGNKNCLKRVGDKATTIKCDKGYTGVSLQFATKEDVTAMSSDGARLITAAADNDVNAVKKFLSSKIDVNSRDWDKLTPLIAASGKGHLAMVKLLISNKADVNLRDKDNITALMEGSMGGHKDVVDLLVKNGASIDVLAASGVSPLWLAAGEGHLSVVNYLLDKKADPNNQRVDGVTALAAAAAGGHVEVVSQLLKKGAQVNVKDKDGITPLISASENGTLPLVKLLVSNKADLNALSDTGFSPLIIAAAHGHKDVVSTLLDAGAELELDHPEKVTALMCV